MTPSQIDRARQIIKNKPTLIWSTNDFSRLSAKSITEAILNYANWKEFQSLKNIFGLKQLKKIFSQLIKQKRVNLRPSTINYFKLYFNRHAS